LVRVGDCRSLDRPGCPTIRTIDTEYEPKFQDVAPLEQCLDLFVLASAAAGWRTHTCVYFWLSHERLENDNEPRQRWKIFDRSGQPLWVSRIRPPVGDADVVDRLLKDLRQAMSFGVSCSAAVSDQDPLVGCLRCRRMVYAPRTGNVSAACSLTKFGSTTYC
jgi:hypothetical protein